MQTGATRHVFSSAGIAGTAAFAALTAAALLLTGCGIGAGTGAGQSGSGSGASLHVSGRVYGGQQPISQSVIQLYTVGTTGLKSASTALIGSTVTTDANGNFNITGQYQCNDGVDPAATQVYITATGGAVGGGSANSDIELVAALGSCSSLSSSTFIDLNELTTVAAAYALAPFTADAQHIGASGSNPAGLVNAFANAELLVDTPTGVAGNGPVPTGVTVPVAELNTLGDIIASCVNSAGASSSGCSTLNSATGASDTFDMALGIARNPSANAVVALYPQATGTSPFQPTLTQQPSDFTVAVTSTANSTLATPYGIALDASGNAWITNESGTNLVEVNADGGLVDNATSLGLSGAEGVAVDRNGNVWVADTAGNNVVKAVVSGSSISSSSSYTSGGISGPAAIAIDGDDNAWIANYDGNSVTALTNTGSALGESPFTPTGLSVPTGIAISTSGKIYVNSGNGTVIKLTASGAYTSTLTDNALQGDSGLALDPSSDVIATGFTTGTSVSGAISEIASSGTASAVSPISSSTVVPAGVATDGTSVWIANSASSGGLLQMSFGSATAVSPAAGYGGLNAPQSVAVDSSGSVWTTNAGSNTVSKFIGLAVPVATPIASSVTPIG